MAYIPIIETTDKIKFKEIINLLVSKNIKFEVLNEYTLYKEEDYGETSGGAIIRVPKKKFVLADGLLISHGYKELINRKSLEFKTVNNWLSKLNNIPLLNRLMKPVKLVLIFFLFFSVPLIIMFIYSVNWKGKDITDQILCVKNIDSNGSRINLRTEDQLIVVACKESIQFLNTGKVYFPGLNTKKIEGSWKTVGNKNLIEVFDVDCFSNIYEGKYSIKWKPIRNEYILKSKSTIIKLKPKI